MLDLNDKKHVLSLKGLNDFHEWQLLKDYFQQELDKLMDITTIESFEELQGRKEAIRIFETIIKLIK